MSENSVPALPMQGAGDVPTDAQSAFIAAAARQKAGDIEGAIKLYRRVIDLDPLSSDAYNNLLRQPDGAGQDGQQRCRSGLRRHDA